MKRLYVESNFVLELVFAQEDREHCETLLDGAESGTFELAIPSYCLGEPLETLGRRHSDRRRVQNALQQEVRQLRRVTEYRTDLDDVDLRQSVRSKRHRGSRSAAEEIGRAHV